MGIHFGHRNTQNLDGSTKDSWFLYTCGHCGRDVSGAVLVYAADEGGRTAVRWLQCPSCHRGSVDVAGKIYPGTAFGPKLKGLPAAVESAYEEARSCFTVSAFTAAEGLCRKILMYVGVDKGAKAGDTFASYISHLEKEGYVTPPMRAWVKLIKDHGNKAQHSLDPADKERAEGTLQFTAQLLRSVYEMGHLASEFTKAD